MTSRYSMIQKCLGKEDLLKVNNAKILVVGAGGIGCELLKNLVMTGFKHINIIDLDTIDISNLNRQFLFRKHHVGKSKSSIARESVLVFNDDPKVQIVAHHGNIKEKQYDINFFKKFDLVINALDNLDARRHVNRLCIVAKKPLIEAGTAGYLGQAFVIQGGVTECYECQPKPTQTKYPICTIRSTPDKPIHCIVWAKELFKLLFGVKADSALWDGEGAVDDDNETKDDSTLREVSVYMDAVSRHPIIDETEKSEAILDKYCRDVFHGIFNLEIKKKLSMKKYDGSKHTPTPVEVNIDSLNHKHVVAEHTVPSLNENVVLWFRTVKAIWRSRFSEVDTMQFDKDIDLDVDFVTASSNIRSYTFNIPPQSRFKVKEIAGNIIPAIATTNAIVAGIQVLEAIKILRGMDIKTSCKYTYCVRNPNRKGFLLQPIELGGPNPQCYVCQKAPIHLSIDTEYSTLKDLVEVILKKNLGFNSPTIQIDGSGIWEEGEDCEDFSEFLDKSLSSLPAGGIHDGSILTVEDFTQDMEIDLIVTYKKKSEFDEKKNPDFFSISGAKPLAKVSTPKKKEASPKKENNKKRPREEEEENGEEEKSKKKQKQEINLEIDDDDCIVLD